MHRYLAREGLLSGGRWVRDLINMKKERVRDERHLGLEGVKASSQDYN
jgi:hypothetical protein